MKILHIIARLNVGGPARQVILLVKELQDAETSSALISGRVPAGEEDMGYLADENGVKPIFIDEMSRELSAGDIISLLKVYRRIGREKPDIIHTHTAKAGTVGRAAAFAYRWLTWRTLIGRPRRVAVVHTFHGHVFHSYYGRLKTSVFVVIEKLLALVATDKIIVLSPQQLREISGEVGIGSPSQFTILPLGIDLEPFRKAASNRAAIRNELGIADNELAVGFVGRLTDIKNVSLYLQAAEIYKKDHAMDVAKLRFLVVGDGHLRGALEAEAFARGVDHIVQFLGSRTDVEAIYAGLDIVAMTSHNEGTPLSVIEAMASDRAVIATEVGGVVDLLGEKREEHEDFDVCERGIGVRPNRPQSFANGLIYLVKNERLRESIAKNGRELVEAAYSEERLLKDIRELYESLIR